MPSRSLDDLRPEFRALVDPWLEACAAQGLDVLVYCTYRSTDEQAKAYAQGRTAPGHVVTNAKPGESAHNFRLALDFVPMIHGKPDWDNQSGFYHKAVDLAVAHGLESLEHSRFPELAHIQMPNWRTYSEGKT